MIPPSTAVAIWVAYTIISVNGCSCCGIIPLPFSSTVLTNSGLIFSVIPLKKTDRHINRAVGLFLCELFLFDMGRRITMRRGFVKGGFHRDCLILEESKHERLVNLFHL